MFNQELTTLFFLSLYITSAAYIMFQRKVAHPPEEEKEEEMDEEALEEEDVIGNFPPPQPVGGSSTLTKRSRLSVVSEVFDSGNKVRCLYLSVLSCTCITTHCLTLQSRDI